MTIILHTYAESDYTVNEFLESDDVSLIVHILLRIRTVLQHAEVRRYYYPMGVTEKNT